QADLPAGSCRTSSARGPKESRGARAVRDPAEAGPGHLHPSAPGDGEADRQGHDMALRLWASGLHEARILASMVDDPAAVTDEQMETWAGDFDSGDLVDQCCTNLFASTAFAWAKAEGWSGRD